MARTVSEAYDARGYPIPAAMTDLLLSAIGGNRDTLELRRQKAGAIPCRTVSMA